MAARRSRFSVWRRRALLFLLGGPLVYLLLMNAFLNSGIIPRLLSEKPKLLNVHWAWAWSLVPGRVHVYGFALRVQDPKTQFEFYIEKAVTAVQVTALLERRFQTAWVVASGVEFRLRPRLARDEDAAELGKFFPPIEGFADALVADPPDPPLVIREEDTWAVQLENVMVLGAREVWVGPYRGALDADVHGRMWLKLDHSLSIGPASVLIHQASVFQGPLPTVSGLAGTAECTVALKNSLVDEGSDVWQSLDWKADVKGQLDSLGFLEHHLGVAVEGGKASLEVSASAVRGALDKESRLDVVGEEAFFLLGPYRLRGAWSAHALGPKLAVEMSPFHLETMAGDKLFQSTGLKATLEASELVLGKMPEDGKLSLVLAPTGPFRVGIFNPFVAGEAFKIDSGTAVLSARLLVDAKGKSGALTLKTGPTQVRVGRNRIRGEAAVDLDLARLKFNRGSVELSGSSVEFTNVEVISSRARPRGWAGKLTLDNAQLKLRPKPGGNAQVSGSFSDARPFLALFGDQAGLPRWSTPLFEAAGLKVKGTLGFAGASLLLRDLEATGEGLQIRGQLDVTSQDVTGAFLVKVQGFTVGLKVSEAVVESQLQDADNWYAKQVVLLKM